MPQLETFRDYLESHIAETSFEQISSLNTSKFSRLTDSELVDLLTKGDRGAASEYWDRYSKSVRGILKRILGPKKDVESTLQRVFRAAYRDCIDGKGQDGLGVCTLKATVRIARAALQKRKRISFIPTPRHAKASSNFALDLSDDSWTLSYLYEIYEKLDGDGRLAFMLRQLEQMDLEDVAASLGWSTSRTQASISKTQATVLARAREVVAPQTGASHKENLIEKKDAKNKRDRAALKVITELTRKSITGETDSSKHFSGREAFLEDIDHDEISEYSNSRSKRTLAILLIAFFVIVLGLICSRVISGHWPLERSPQYTELAEVAGQTQPLFD